MAENLDQSVGALIETAEALCPRMALVSEFADKISNGPEISPEAPVKRLVQMFDRVVEEMKDVRQRYGKESWTIFRGLQQREETVVAEKTALDSRRSEFDASCNTLKEDQQQMEVQRQELEAEKGDHANKVHRHEEAVADMNRQHAENVADINRQRQEMQEKIVNLESREAALDREKTEMTRLQGQMTAEKDDLKRQREQLVRDQSAAVKVQQDAMKAVGEEKEKNAVHQERLKCDRESFEAQKAGSNREMTREKEEFAGEKQQLVRDKEKLARDQAKLARDQEKLARDQEKLARDREKLADDEEDMIGKEQRLISELEQLDHDRTELATDQGKMIASRETLATDQQKFSKDRQDLDKQIQQHAIEEGKLLAKQDTMAAEKEKMARERTKLSTDVEKHAIDQGKMIAGQTALAEAKQKLSDDRRDLEKKVQQQAIDEGKLISKQETMVAEKDALAAEKETLASDRKKLTDDIEKHASDQVKMADERKTFDDAKKKLETDAAQFASNMSSLQGYTSEFEQTYQREKAKFASDKDTVAHQMEQNAIKESALIREKADLAEATANVANDRQGMDRERLALDEKKRLLEGRELNFRETLASLNDYNAEHFAGVRRDDREELARLKTNLEESRLAASVAQSNLEKENKQVTELGNLRASDLAENARLQEKVSHLQKALESSQQAKRAEAQPEGSRSTASLVQSDQGPREAGKRAREESSSPQPRKNRKMEDELIAKLAAQSWEDVVEHMTSFFRTWKVKRSKDSQLCPTITALVQMSAILSSDQPARDLMSRFGGDHRRQDWVCFDAMVKSGHKWLGSIIDPETLSCPQHGQKGCLQVKRVGNREIEYRYIGREVSFSEFR